MLQRLRIFQIFWVLKFPHGWLFLFSGGIFFAHSCLELCFHGFWVWLWELWGRQEQRNRCLSLLYEREARNDAFFDCLEGPVERIMRERKSVIHGVLNVEEYFQEFHVLFRRRFVNFLQAREKLSALTEICFVLLVCRIC